VIENYVEPNYESEAQLADPTLLSVVSLVLVIHHIYLLLHPFSYSSRAIL